jgi:hypothetical protein
MKNQLNLIKLYAILRIDKLLGSKGDQNMMLLTVPQEFSGNAGDVLGNSTGPASSTLFLGATNTRKEWNQNSNQKNPIPPGEDTINFGMSRNALVV